MGRSLWRGKNGFTLMEVLIAAAILVIIMALATLMFAKAEKMTRTIRYEADVSSVMSVMINEILYGTQTRSIEGLSDANSFVYQNPSAPNLSSNYLIYTNPSSSSVYYAYLIAPGLNSGPPPEFPYTGTGTDTTLWQGYSTSLPSLNWHWQSLDFNKKIILQSGSGFQYYNSDNGLLNNLSLSDSNTYDTATYVKITLIAKSNDPALQNMPPVDYETSVRIKNKPSF